MTRDLSSTLHDRLDGRSPSDQKYLLAATLEEFLPDGAQTTLVGGSLVELLTLGAVTSLDLDLVADRRVVKRLLEAAGFTEGPLAMFRHPEWDVVINTVGNGYLEPPQTRQIIRFEGLPLHAVSNEDAIIDRLNGAKHWRHQVDHERAMLLLRVLGDELDMDRLWARARQESVEDILQEILDLLSQHS